MAVPPRVLLGLALGGVLLSAGRAEEPAADAPRESTPEEHSDHGEAFNDGPRQAAYLMGGTGAVDFPVTTADPAVRGFVEQGVGQLHGFWYFEAERSFRQAAASDPDCAMAYWGMAMANANNRDRAKDFIEEAVERKEAATDREKRYIDALHAYLDDDGDRKTRGREYARALEELVLEHPGDVEAKALLCLQLWQNSRAGIPVASHLAVDALLEEIFEARPAHPAHHYRIHLWDRKRPEKALESAALCGPAAPAIAHMWHMPGHIYSKLKRYDDAAWQQEASARVDHAHMMRDGVLPDQIHNFAHNNEWLIRNLVHLGRAADAVDLAKNMTELPRHPEYNTFEKRGSARYGRRRLFEALSRFELWDDLLAYSETPYLGRTDHVGERAQRLRFVGRACFRSGRVRRGDEQIALLERLLADREAARDAAVAEATTGDELTDGELTGDELEKARKQAGRPFASDIAAVEKALTELRGHRALADGDAEAALTLFEEAGDLEAELLVRVELAAGRTGAALERAAENAEDHPNEVVPLATLVAALWAAGEREKALERFGELRTVARSADLDTPLMDRLRPEPIWRGSRGTGGRTGRSRRTTSGSGRTWPRSARSAGSRARPRPGP